ncbi:MAG: JAB domain-containing protein, partial [Fusobacteriaceae bacterium]
ELTEKIRETLNLIDIRLIDHIIVTRESYFSFLEEGLLEI